MLQQFRDAMTSFKLVSNFEPTGDQPQAIEALSRNIRNGKRHNVLLGVTGSGKTFTMAHVIARTDKPTLVLAPNKTLAAQLYNEFKQLFPENAVEYFVSYYDYYQPEAYIPSTDTYIQKDSSINDMIDKLRHSATRSVLSRRDIVVVASVSCIFGLGAPEDYLSLRVDLEVNMELSREKFLFDLVSMHYERNDVDFSGAYFGYAATGWKFFRPMKKIRRFVLIFSGTRLKALLCLTPSEEKCSSV